MVHGWLRCTEAIGLLPKMHLRREIYGTKMHSSLEDWPSFYLLNEAYLRHCSSTKYSHVPMRSLSCTSVIVRI